MEEKETLRERLIKFYEKEGIWNNLLHEVCKEKDKCWKDRARIPTEEVTGGKWLNEISLPYIGEDYEEGRIVFVGINFNEYGGKDKCEELVRYAIKELHEGCIKTIKGGSYPGTFLYHRMGAYAAIICKWRKLIKFEDGSSPNDSPPNPSIVEAYRFISYTNHIKCSPIGNRSKPSTAMWEACRYLDEELKILDPKVVVILGKSDNLWWFENKFVKEKDKEGGTEEMKIFTKNNVLYISVPHPTCPRGIKKSLYTSLINSLKEI